MCIYCENENIKASDLKLNDLFIVTSAQYTYVGDGELHYMPLHFCPNCGEKLGGNKHEA